MRESHSYAHVNYNNWTHHLSALVRRKKIATFYIEESHINIM